MHVHLTVPPLPSSLPLLMPLSSVLQWWQLCTIDGHITLIVITYLRTVYLNWTCSIKQWATSTTVHFSTIWIQMRIHRGRGRTIRTRMELWVLEIQHGCLPQLPLFFSWRCLVSPYTTVEWFAIRTFYHVRLIITFTTLTTLLLLTQILILTPIDDMVITSISNGLT